jgi:hypothetical protein
MISPGTSSDASRRDLFPSRITRHCSAASLPSISRDRSARYSWTKPKTALRKRMAKMAAASKYSPKSTEMTTVPKSTSTMKSWN